ncbi:MAG: substrate-binding domain-containing protein [Haloferula sp.]
MSQPSFSPIRNQLADHLRQEISRGRWKGTIPGRNALAADLGMNRKTVESALKILGDEGLLVSQGRGRRRRIVLPKGGLEAPPLRVAILRDTSEGRNYDDRLHHYLSQDGHEILKPRQVRMGVPRLGRLVDETAADAWVVLAGPREVLEWFAERSAPTFALFGARRGLPIAGAGPDHVPAMLAAVRRLVSLGHHRIVLLVREPHRVPPLLKFTQCFLDELGAQGISTSRYNLPSWKETPEGLKHCLDSLFKTTPPTALIVDEAFLFAAVQQYLARRGILAPDHISLVCIDPDPTFDWLRPSVAHLSWNQDQILKRAQRWVNSVASGKDDRAQSFTKARFVDGGTVGAVP